MQTVHRYTDRGSVVPARSRLCLVGSRTRHHQSAQTQQSQFDGDVTTTGMSRDGRVSLSSPVVPVRHWELANTLRHWLRVSRLWPLASAADSASHTASVGRFVCLSKPDVTVMKLTRVLLLVGILCLVVDCVDSFWWLRRRGGSTMNLRLRRRGGRTIKLRSLRQCCLRIQQRSPSATLPMFCRRFTTTPAPTTEATATEPFVIPAPAANATTA